ncbi:MAG: NAD-dependent epimerase/dehydratase family protein [Egibacteraceae bacterium]
MHIVVTGGAGFIGSAVVDLLVAEGHAVRVLDSLLPDAHEGKPSYLNEAADYVIAGLDDLPTLREIVAGADAVSHQAARVGLGLDLADITAYTADNAYGTAALLRALGDTGFAGRLVLASSMVVYGEGRYACPAHGPVRPRPRAPADLDAGRFERCCGCGRPLEPGTVTEDAPLDPRSIYAASKVHQEHLCQVSGFPVTALRYHNVYGPRMPRDTPYAGVASIFRSAYEAGRAPGVFEDGRQLRDFVHVDDVARANMIALTAVQPFSGAFNVASGNPRTVLDLATALHAAYPPGTPPPEVTGRWRAGDVRHVFASPDKAARELGFRAKVDFEEGVHAFAHAPLRNPPAFSRGKTP